MKCSHLLVGLFAAVPLLVGCPVASTQQAVNVAETSVESAVAPPSVDYFAPRSPLEGLQVSTPTKTEPEVSVSVPDFPAPTTDSPVATTDPPVSVPDFPAPTTDSPVATTNLPTSTFDFPAPDSVSPIATIDSPVPTPEDRAHGSWPSEETPRPSEETPRPSEETPRPSEEIPRPSEEIPRPSEEIPRPSEEIPRPSEEIPRPSEEMPRPSEETPRPSEEMPEKPNFESTWTPPAMTSFADAPAVIVDPKPEATPEPVAVPVAAVDATTPIPELQPPEPQTLNSEPRIQNLEPQPLSPEPQPPTPTSYDPVKANGEYFVDWPKPKALLVFSGFIDGYVEPCGCAGLEQMKGGLSRRSTFLKELDKKGWPIIPIEAGNLNKGFGRQEEWKYNFVTDESLRLMKYEIVGLGNRELQFPTDVLILYCVDVPGSPRRYTSANVELLDTPGCITPFRTQTMNGVKVGVISVIGKSMFGEINNQDVKQLDIVESLKEVLPVFDEEKCHQRVLIVHGSNAEFQTVLKAFPNNFDFALCSDGPAEPPAEPQWIGNTMHIDVGEKGKYTVAVGLFDDADTPMRYQRVALDSRFKNSPDVMQAMRFYQNELKKAGLNGLGIKAIPNRRAAENGTYVGSKTCADCHEPSQKVWQKSQHAQAWKSLAQTANPPRTFDPECIACHVVGWNPTEFLPYTSGFLGEKETPHLVDVGCESCHGPGERHVAAEKTADDDLKQKLRKAVRLPLEGNAAKKLCIECHDGDNSPHFDFDTYWPKIQHKEE